MILLNIILYRIFLVKCEQIKAWDFMMFKIKVLHVEDIILYWFFESSHREKQASLRILRKYEGYDNLWMWCDACDIWMRGGQVAQKLTFEASLAHNLILCANSAGSLCCFSSQKSGFFLVWEYLRYPTPTHKMFFFADFCDPQTRNGRGPNLWKYIVRTTPHSPLACCSLPFPCRCRLDLFHTIWKPFSQMQNPNVVFQMDGVQAVPPLRRPYCAKKGHLWSSG